MKNNRHIDSIPSLAIEQATIKINEINLSFAPYIVPLTPTERKEILKMGEKTLNFVEKAHDLAHSNPKLVPAFLDMDAFDIDFSDAHGLWTLITGVLRLYENLCDTEMIAGSEAYQAALVFYNSVKSAAAQDVDGAKAVYEQLYSRFSNNGRKGGSTETETITETITKKESHS
jgi:hypothetical protein